MHNNNKDVLQHCQDFSGRMCDSFISNLFDGYAGEAHTFNTQETCTKLKCRAGAGYS